MAKHDAVVIGAGASGLTVGALLANAGMKVLILEKASNVGGRGTSQNHNGYIVDNGTHAFVIGNFDDVFSRLGKPCPRLRTQDFATEIFHEGKWRSLGDLFPHKELRKIISEHILPLSDEEIGKLDDVPLSDWVSEFTDNEGIHFYFWFVGWLAQVGGTRYDALSAGDLLSYVKPLLTKYGRFKEVGVYWPDGISALWGPLTEVIKAKGSQIKFNTNVSRIVIEGGRARGVEVEEGERIIPGQILHTGFIEAPIVINTLPVWDLFTVVSPDEFPGWYVEWVREIGEKVCYVWGFQCNLDRPITDEPTIKVWMKSPTGGKVGPGGMGPFPGYGETAGRHVVHFWQQAWWFDVPPNFKSGNRIISHEARKVLDVFEKDVKALFPDLDSCCREKIYFADIYSVAEAPRSVGRHRPGIQPPGVKDLYLVSDTLRHHIVAGVASAIRCALLCADTILDKR